VRFVDSEDLFEQIEESAGLHPASGPAQKNTLFPLLCVVLWVKERVGRHPCRARLAGTAYSVAARILRRLAAGWASAITGPGSCAGASAAITGLRCQPVGQRGGSGLLLDEELARAVRCESASAIAYWWRVSQGVVWRWWRVGMSLQITGTV